MKPIADLIKEAEENNKNNIDSMVKKSIDDLEFDIQDMVTRGITKRSYSIFYNNNSNLSNTIRAKQILLSNDFIKNTCSSIETISDESYYDYGQMQYFMKFNINLKKPMNKCNKFELFINILFGL